MIPQKEIKQFQKEILLWYTKNKRDLPWRQTRDPYRILVSEIMLQQTQVSRVIPKYAAWLAVFPTLESLANAKTAEVLKLWSGLGYNRRALYLQKCAKEIIEKNHGVFPKNPEILKKLPGIGDYTAAAIACFAFGQQVAVVDTNVRKVILVHFSHVMLKQVQDDTIKKVADQLLPIGKAAEWNQALMDYASSMLKKEKIPMVKQSTFKGSNRYYRGQIIKILLEKQKVTMSELVEQFQKDEAFVVGIVQGLVKDGMVKKKGKRLFIESA